MRIVSRLDGGGVIQIERALLGVVRVFDVNAGAIRSE